MRNFQQKRRWRNIFESRPVLILLGVLILIFAWNVFGFMGKMRLTTENRKMAENKVGELKSKKQEFASDIENLNTDEGKEKIFRENFGLARAGEGLVVVVEEKKETQAETSTDSSFFSFLLSWMDWFK